MKTGILAFISSVRLFVLLAILILLAFVLQAVRSCDLHRGKEKLPDTIRIVARPPVQVIAKPTLPEHVTIYTKPDTILRHHIEHQQVVIGETFTPSKLSIETLSPAGLAMTKTYSLADYKLVQVDTAGHVLIKRRTWIGRTLRKAKGPALFVAGAVVAGLTVKTFTR